MQQRLQLSVLYHRLGYGRSALVVKGTWIDGVKRVVHQRDALCRHILALPARQGRKALLGGVGRKHACKSTQYACHSVVAEYYIVLTGRYGRGIHGGYGLIDGLPRAARYVQRLTVCPECKAVPHLALILQHRLHIAAGYPVAPFGPEAQSVVYAEPAACGDYLAAGHPLYPAVAPLCLPFQRLAELYLFRFIHVLQGIGLFLYFGIFRRLRHGVYILALYRFRVIYGLLHKALRVIHSFGIGVAVPSVLLHPYA